MQTAAHVIQWHGLRIADMARSPLWRLLWNAHQQKCGGPGKFPPADEFLENATNVYHFLQEQLLTASNTRHLEDLCTDDLWPTVRSVGADYHEARREFGDNLAINWASTNAYIIGLGLPEERKQYGLGQTVVVGARFFSRSTLSYVPSQVRHGIDELDFVSTWDAETGVDQWKIARIGGPVTPSE